MDYTGNSKKVQQEGTPKPKKNIERVTTSEVLVKKKSVGSKFKDLFIMADFRSVTQYIIADVLLPAARNMIVDATQEGIKRIVYGERAIRRQNYNNGPRVTYNNPINRGYQNTTSHSASRTIAEPRVQRAVREDFILASLSDAEQVVERMNDIVDTYEVISVADFNELVGYPSTHVDNKWGWTVVGNIPIRQVREGYLIDLPPAEPIN